MDGQTKVSLILKVAVMLNVLTYQRKKNQISTTLSKKGAILENISFKPGTRTPDYPRTSGRHKKFLGDLQENFRDRVAVRYRLFEDPKKVEDAEKKFGWFACVRRRTAITAGDPIAAADEECLVIEPDFSESKTVLRLFFSRGPGNDDSVTSPYLDRFALAYSDPESKDSTVATRDPRGRGKGLDLASASGSLTAGALTTLRCSRFCSGQSIQAQQNSKRPGVRAATGSTRIS